MATGNRSLSGKAALRLRHMLDFCRRVLRPPVAPLNPPDALPPLEDDLELSRLGNRFSNQIFAHLLLELPDHRKTMDTAYKTGDYLSLRHSVHQLLGATAYCDAPELETGLRELRQALHSEDRDSLDLNFMRAMNVLDSTLRCSGYSEGD